jgi:hypothetical protein
MPIVANPPFAGAVVGGLGGIAGAVGGVDDGRDGIDMPGMERSIVPDDVAGRVEPGIARFIAPDDIPDPGASACPPISCAPTTLARMGRASPVQRIRDLLPILSMVGPRPRS